jgi:hypothetical protein
MNRVIIAKVITFCALVIIPLNLVFAQEQSEIELGLTRNFGFSSGSGKIQGTFTATAIGPDDMIQASFYLDGHLMGEVKQSPFKLRFNTDSYALGVHTIHSLGQTREGRQYRSNEIKVEFVSAEEGWQAGMRFTVPILVISFGAMALSFMFMFLTADKQKTISPGAPRNYGISGGAICPKCRRPFPRHLFAPNLVTGKLERCPFCGKWSVVRAASMSELRAAEIAELESSSPPGQTSSQEDLLRDLDDSRFLDQ